MSGTSGWGTVLGPDVSFYQDAPNTPQQIDFEQMKRAGAEFVIIRAGQGKYPDSDFAYNWLSAKAAGLPRGAYWFYDPRESPINQANLFVSLLKDDPPELIAFLDLEKLVINNVVITGNYDGWGSWKLCLQNLRVNLPRTGIYTAPAYWIANRPQDANEWPFFKSFELWIANYGVSTPLIPLPWTSAVFWQFGTPELGIQFGCESREIDLNYFYGNSEEFHNYFSLPYFPPPAPPSPPMPEPVTGEAMYEGTAKFTSTPNVRIRKPNPDGSLNETGMTIGAIQPGQAFKGDKLSPDSQGRGNWMHVIQVGGTAIDGWSAGWLLDYHEANPPPATVVYPSSVTLNYEDGTHKEYIPQ